VDPLALAEVANTRPFGHPAEHGDEASRPSRRPPLPLRLATGQGPRLAGIGTCARRLPPRRVEGLAEGARGGLWVVGADDCGDDGDAVRSGADGRLGVGEADP